jgi:replicative DNA helicase
MDSNTTPTKLGKSLPHAIDVERQIIGAMMLDGEAIANAREILKEDDFFLDKHQTLYASMASMNDRNVPVDSITLAENLTKSNQLEKVGGESFILELSAEVLSWAHISQHAKIVKEKSTLRHLILACNDILKECYENSKEIAEILDESESKVFKVGDDQVSQGFIPISKALTETFKIIEQYSKNELMGVPSGFTDLDRLTGGFQKTDLIILAGRPAMGKTAVTLSMMANAALKSDRTIAFFSLEMGQEQLVQRILCREAKINLQALRQGKLPKRDYGKLIDVAGDLNKAKIFIDDTPNQTPIQIRSKCRRLAQQKQGLDLVIIDYLQLMNVSGKVENRTQEISQISRALKGLAKELNIPVIALSQLSRAVESRADGKPMLSDLRESGAIEQDADIVMFIYREEVYKPEDPTLNGKAEIIVAKQRNGPTGEANLTFIKDYASFENYSPREEYEL